MKMLPARRLFSFSISLLSRGDIDVGRSRCCRARRCRWCRAAHVIQRAGIADGAGVVVWVIVVEVSASSPGRGARGVDGDGAGIADGDRWQLQLAAGFDFEVAGIGEDVAGSVLVLDLVAAAGDIDVAGEVCRARRC